MLFLMFFTFQEWNLKKILNTEVYAQITSLSLKFKTLPRH